MKREEPHADEPRADETAPGLRVIKEVWDIKTPKVPRDAVPRTVPHDIYNVPVRKDDVPRRSGGGSFAH